MDCDVDLSHRSPHGERSVKSLSAEQRKYLGEILSPDPPTQFGLCLSPPDLHLDSQPVTLQTAISEGSQPQDDISEDEISQYMQL
ncbi:hypothetical protein RSOLAG1IB_09884 [Rhizoctonia solani AG-1 IB]|uniref:Uncharacterized protein n=1 Tax=Thanatephorus cucumeris (strain AG1-IB / isolate 7/3/14) TaxID=1108050 RepID=A0A0B7FYK7_THACB|nr:hypothetical protein RSOLAG1IB_09884 [Rhizoctonia solani AG-1 IB]